ncbi:MAG: methylated-DNA--[protein]-cysteine S-methyltransferase [Chloroflexi bacterium]|nr:methylated-DNA--[protein]-cysteine S-methyltransferase [Chloroflexota bacterium]MDA1219803.1 methylated-DNA--[protein]-cysteine S-methyltransferase [Chloroflexota bacterium]
MSQLKSHIFESPMGWIGLVGTDQGLRRLSLKPTLPEVLEDLGEDVELATADPKAFTHEQDCLTRFFAGDSRALDRVVLDLANSPPFFGAAWEACRRIPPGETRSYQWLAAEAGSPLAARAAGQAMAKNPWALVIPCHRVIGSDGGLHGYGAGGLTVKARLLEMERASLASDS